MTTSFNGSPPAYSLEQLGDLVSLDLGTLKIEFLHQLPSFERHLLHHDPLSWVLHPEKPQRVDPEDGYLSGSCDLVVPYTSPRKSSSTFREVSLIQAPSLALCDMM